MPFRDRALTGLLTVIAFPAGLLLLLAIVAVAVVLRVVGGRDSRSLRSFGRSFA